MIHDRFLEVKDLIGNLCRGNADFLFETIDDNHNTFSGNTRNGQGVKPGIFQIGPEISAKIGYSRDTGQRRQRNCHAFACARKLRYAAQRTRRKDQWIFRIVRPGLRGNFFMQEIEPQPSTADKEISNFRVKHRDGNGLCCQINMQDLIGIPVMKLPVSIFHIEVSLKIMRNVRGIIIKNQS